MLFFLVNRASGNVVDYLSNGSMAREQAVRISADVVSRWDWKSLKDAEKVAASATELFGRVFLATDSGAGVYPRFDVIEAPAVGEAVSYAFNGDSYPCGVITKISASLKVITTSTGEVFYRRNQTGNWKKRGGTWSLISGHHNERNPSF